MKSIFVGFMS